MTDEILIKKYDNRRLYCVAEAKYVSLTEIRDMLQSGKRVKVVEKSTGKDITKYIMMQVLLEDRYDPLPTHFYQMILQSPKEVVEQFFQQFFPWMLDAYRQFRENGAPGMMGSGGFANPWMQQMQQNPFLQQFPSPWGMPPSRSGFGDSPPAGGREQKMDEILERLQELEKKLGKKKDS